MKYINNIRNSKATIIIAGIISIILGVYNIIAFISSGGIFSSFYAISFFASFLLYFLIGILLFIKKISLIKYVVIIYLLIYLYFNFHFLFLLIYSFELILTFIFWMAIILIGFIKKLKKYALFISILPIIILIKDLPDYLSLYLNGYSYFVMQLVIFRIFLPQFLNILLCLLIVLENDDLEEIFKSTKNIKNKEYRNMFVFIILMLFTFGIYYLCWIYKVTRLTNQCKTEEYRNPINKLLLCMFVPFYLIYWTYQTAKRIDKLCNSDIATLTLILAIFIPIVPPIIIQNTINGGFKKVIENKYLNNKALIDDSLSIAESLKKYKELLDTGAINETEYEKIKKELLKINNL